MSIVKTVEQEAIEHNERMEAQIKAQEQQGAAGDELGGGAAQGDSAESTPGAQPPTPSTPVTEIPKEYQSLVDNLLSEATERARQEAMASAKPSFASETIAFLNQLEESGIQLTPDVISESIMDYDKFDLKSISDQKALIAKKLAIDHPDLSPQKIDRMIALKYKGLAEDEGSDERDEAEFKMLEDASSARKFFKERQEKYKLPPRESKEVINQREQQRLEKQEREIRAQFAEISKEFKGVPYKVGEEEHLVEFTPEQLKAVEDIYVHPAKILDSFRTDKGFDGEGFNRFLVNGLYNDQMIKAAAKQAFEAGKKAAITAGDNFRPPAEPTATDTKPEVKPLAQQMQEKFGGNGVYNIPIT